MCYYFEEEEIVEFLAEVGIDGALNENEMLEPIPEVIVIDWDEEKNWGVM